MTITTVIGFQNDNEPLAIAEVELQLKSIIGKDAAIKSEVICEMEAQPTEEDWFDDKVYLIRSTFSIPDETSESIKQKISEIHGLEEIR